MVSNSSKNSKVYTVFGFAFLGMAFLNLMVGYLLLGTIMAVGALAVLWFLRFGYQFTAARGYKKVLAKNHGQPPERSVYFFEDKIKVVSEEKEQTWKYDQIRYVKQGKLVMVLGLHDNHVVMLDANSFENINRAAFIEYLGQKCPKAVW